MVSAIYLKNIALLSYAIVGIHASVLLHNRALPAGWSALGCYTDSTGSRSLRAATYADGSAMTIESCIAFCTPNGYKYAGVEYAGECFCDNVIQSPGALTTNEGCNMACTGNSAQTCGGPDRINIYQSGAVATTTTSTTTSSTTSTTTTSTTTTAAASPTIKATAGTWQYKGCFGDGLITTYRTLATGVTVPGGVTVEGCTAACKARGFPLAGLEYGQECWCDTFMEIVNSKPNSECNKPCQADAGTFCGAGARLAVYQDTTATPPSLQQCLSNFQLPLITVHLQARPLTGGAIIPLNGIDTPLDENGSSGGFFSISVDTGSIYSYRNFRVSNTANVNENVLYVTEPEYFSAPSIAPLVGGGQFFELTSFGGIYRDPYKQYCAKPNPNPPFGPFIGPPVLAVNGQVDQWALCANNTQPADGRIDVVYSPVATNPQYSLSQCIRVTIEIQT